MLSIIKESVPETVEYICSFFHIDLRLSQNIPVSVSYEDGEYFVESDLFRLYACGKSYCEAKETFEE